MTVWIKSKNRGGAHSCEKPCPTVMKLGMADDTISSWSLEDDGIMVEPVAENGKPPYRVSSMQEVRKLSWNGLTVASFFSGCGGSCLGYRMAGFKVAYANEWDAHARECYILNHGANIDPRDINEVQAEDVLAAIRMQPGELDVLDGSPPCQGFSTAGKRVVSDGRNNLFFEYARLLRGIQPKAFVAENVSGMAKGTMKGIFLEVLRELKACGYNVRCKVLDAQWLGVPQVRKRVIFVGFREDLGVEPAFPEPLPYRYSVRDACGWIAAQPANDICKDSRGDMQTSDVPSRTVSAAGHGASRVIHDGSRLGVYYRRGGYISGQNVTDTPSPVITATQCGLDVVELAQDLTLPISVQPSCEGKQVFGAVNPVDPNGPCPTVQTFPHDTPLQTEKRKLTIGELRRICSFPDDFKLSGSYAKQWARLGNSVPPVMMRAISACVRDQLHSI